MTKQEAYARVHRFHDYVALDTESTNTVYLSPTLARQLGTELLRYAADIEAVKFTKSTLGSVSLQDIPDRYQIAEAVGGGFIVFRNGFHGAGDTVFPTREDAVAYVREDTGLHE